MIEHFEVFVFRFQFAILLQRCRCGVDIAQLVIDQREVEVNQREPGFDPRRGFVVKLR